MKKAKNLFASILVIGSILMYSDCRNIDVISPDPIINVSSDTTIILPTSIAILSGSVDNSNGHTYNFLNIYEWTVERAPLNTPDLKIEDPSSPQTYVTGLTRPGEYEFLLTCVFTGSRGSSRYWFGNRVKVTVLRGMFFDNTFSISPNVYRVQSVERAGNYIKASSFRDGADSASITFFFLSADDLPRRGGDRKYSVRSSVSEVGEVKVIAVRTKGNDGTEYDCIGLPKLERVDSLSATVSNIDGKISIYLPDQLAKKLQETDTVHVSADIYEP